jgi:hypothetical protein
MARDVRDAVCEAACDYVTGLNSPEFAAQFGGPEGLLNDLRKAVQAWCDELADTASAE